MRRGSHADNYEGGGGGGGLPGIPGICQLAGTVMEGKAMIRVTSSFLWEYEPCWLGSANCTVTFTSLGSWLVCVQSSTQSLNRTSQNSNRNLFTPFASTNGCSFSSTSTSIRIGFCRNTSSRPEPSLLSTEKVRRRTSKSPNLPLRGKDFGNRARKLSVASSPFSA